MTRIRYTDHLKLRLNVRKIPYDYPKEIYEKSDQRFIDKVENKKIAIKRLFYNKKQRNLMVAYEEKDDIVEIVTIHPITDEKIINRVISKRWIKNGKIRVR